MSSTLEQEQAAFERALDELVEEHGGEFVVFKDCAPVAFFKDHRSAYEYGLDEYGLDEVFLVAEVLRRDPVPVSFSWQSGVMFG